MADNPYVPAIIIGLIRLIGTIFGTLLLKRFPRKVLMIGSAALMALTLGLLAATIYYKESLIKNYDQRIVNLLPLIGKYNKLKNPFQSYYLFQRKLTAR